MQKKNYNDTISSIKFDTITVYKRSTVFTIVNNDTGKKVNINKVTNNLADTKVTPVGRKCRKLSRLVPDYSNSIAYDKKDEKFFMELFDTYSKNSGIKPNRKINRLNEKVNLKHLKTLAKRKNAKQELKDFVKVMNNRMRRYKFKWSVKCH